MIKKILTRALIVGLIAVMSYFVMLSTKTVTVPIERATVERPDDKDMVRGTNFHYRAFDLEGKEIISGSSQKVTQTGTATFQLEDGFRVRIHEDGKTYDIQADSLKPGPDGSEIIAARAGAAIVITALDGVHIETAGPLVRSSQNIISTSAAANFQMGEAFGRCKGLRFKPGEFLELQDDCYFKAAGPEGTIQIHSDFMTFDQALGKGRILNGTLTSEGGVDRPPTTLLADEIDLSYQTGGEDGSWFLNRARLNGGPAQLVWHQGLLESSSFEICFDQSGTFIEEVLTDRDARFSLLTEDGYDLNGFSGRLTFMFKASSPVLLRGAEAIHLQAQKLGKPTMGLRGGQGFVTEFYSGKAHSTRLHGSPQFEYGTQVGKAGSLQVLHNERNLLLGERAELYNQEEKIRILGDKILLTNWDQTQREIFGFGFVEIIYHEETPQMVRCLGDELAFRLPERYLKLNGEPARVLRSDHTVEANQIEIVQIDEEWFDLKSDSRVRLAFETDKGLLHVVAQRMDFTGATQLLVFDQVSEARIPDLGNLSCGRLEARFKQKQDKRVIDTIRAVNDVILQGAIMEKGERKPISCQADVLTYRPGEAQAHFEGRGRDVVFDHPTSKLRGRELTYNMKDGSMRVESVTHGTTQTTVNLKENASRKN